MLNGLWRNADFVRLWTSLTITHFGGQITFLALPLTAALLLNATPFEMGVLTALESIPFALFGLFAGVMIDRAPKLPIIVWSDIGRALALLVVPICAWFGWLSMGVLYVVGFLIGTGAVIGWPAYQVFMTERVGRERLEEANAKIGISDSAAQLVGPGLAGALIQWLTAPFAILLDAFSFFLSAWILRGIPPGASDAPKMRGASVLADIREGLAEIWHNATLRALAWSIAVWQVFRHAYIAIVVLFAARELGFSPGHVGALWMLAGIGTLGAAGAVEPLNRRFGFGPTMLGGLFGTGVAWLVIGGAAGGEVTASIVFGVGLAALDFSAMVFFINYLTLRQAAAPESLRGRVIATMICVTVSAAPAGGLAGGWLAEHLGLRTAIFFAGVGAMVLVLAVAWASPLLRLRSLREVEPRRVESVAEEMAG
ncbi:MAG: MFS transporter [Betaproteobacteria bacterium]|nr:MFS transporter [Betaproteobacteria bacterium]